MSTYPCWSIPSASELGNPMCPKCGELIKETPIILSLRELLLSYHLGGSSSPPCLQPKTVPHITRSDTGQTFCPSIRLLARVSRVGCKIFRKINLKLLFCIYVWKFGSSVLQLISMTVLDRSLITVKKITPLSSCFGPLRSWLLQLISMAWFGHIPNYSKTTPLSSCFGSLTVAEIVAF